MNRLLQCAGVVAMLLPAAALADASQLRFGNKIVNVSVSENPAPQTIISPRSCQPGTLPVYSHKSGDFWCAGVSDYDEVAGSTQQ